MNRQDYHTSLGAKAIDNNSTSKNISIGIKLYVCGCVRKTCIYIVVYTFDLKTHNIC